MSHKVVEFGDFAISGSCMTVDSTTGVPIYEFTPQKDGAYSIAASVVAWQPGGQAVQWYVQVAWTRNGGALAVDGVAFNGGVGNLGTVGLEHDVVDGRCRLLAFGVNGGAVLWRLQGDRFDITA